MCRVDLVSNGAMRLMSLTSHESRSGHDPGCFGSRINSGFSQEQLYLYFYIFIYFNHFYFDHDDEDDEVYSNFKCTISFFFLE